MITSITKQAISSRRLLRHCAFKNLFGESCLLQKKNVYQFTDWSGLKKSQLSAIPPLPKIQFPMRDHPQHQGMDKDVLYGTTGYQKKDRQPRCNYYALEYKGRVYHVFNAYYYPMGKMIQKISSAIRGKNTPLYKNSKVDAKNGDFCVIVNAADPLFNGKKLLYKNLRYHTGFVGHLRTHSYKSVLNKKPELLYYYLLRKAMPKNKISQKYMENIKIYRGPTHDIPHLPQFAPDRSIYDVLPEINLLEQIKAKPENFTLVDETQPGTAQKMLGSQLASKIPYKGLESIGFDFSQQFIQKKPVKIVPNISNKQYEKLMRHEKKIEERFRIVRAPYKKKTKRQVDAVYMDDERKARKHPEYAMMADEDLPQDDEETVPDIYGRKKDEKDKKK